MASGGALQSDAWREAFNTVPREVFVPRFSLHTDSGQQTFEIGDPGFVEAVYTDTSLVTRRDAAGGPTSSSSAPSLMARMLEAFDVPEGGRVLEVGTGTGYNAALLCHRFGDDHIVTVDIDSTLTYRARQRLAEIGYHPTVITGDGTTGSAEHAPFSGILATCGVHRLPVAWRQQVRPGGIIVVNIGTGIACLKLGQDHGATGRFLPDSAEFMVARPTAESTAIRANPYTDLIVKAPADGWRSVSRANLPGDPDDFLTEMVLPEALELTLHQPDVLGMILHFDDPIHGLVHPPTNSWARITQSDTALLVEYGGPRDLWAERDRLLRRWIEAGRPGPGSYGLTVKPDGEHQLWLDSREGAI